MLLLGNTDWNLYNFRLPLARAARASGMDVVLVSRTGPYVEHLRAEGFRHIALSIDQASRNPFREARTMAHLVNIYRRERPDLVHHVSIKPVLYGSLAARATGVHPVVNAISGLGYAFSSGVGARGGVRWIANTLYRVAASGERTRLIFQNGEDRARMEEAGVVPPSRSRLIRGTGVDIRALHPGASASSDTPTVLFASRLLGDKGVYDYVEAARRLRAAGHLARFLIAGRAPSGHPDAVSDATLEAWRAEGVVEVLGHRDDLPALLAEAWMVVLPTTYGEGVPRILLEAAAMGKPSVATDATGCREIVRNGETGLLVPPRDAGALAAAIGRLLDDEPLRRACGARARLTVEQEYDEESVVAATLDVYREIL